MKYVPCLLHLYIGHFQFDLSLEVFFRFSNWNDKCAIRFNLVPNGPVPTERCASQPAFNPYAAGGNLANTK